MYEPHLSLDGLVEAKSQIDVLKITNILIII
jgi:hypothetical protein